MFKKGPNGGVVIGGIEYSADISALFLLWIAINAFEATTAKLMHHSLMAGPVAILLGVAFILCLLLHEAGHAYTAIALGTPIKGIKLFALGGMAMMEKSPKKAWDEFRIAIAGPIVSVLLWFILISPYTFGCTGVWAKLLATLGFYNLIIAVFNMVPAFPLDGGRVFRSIIWGICKNVLKATTLAVRVSEGIVALYLLFSLYNIRAEGFSIIWSFLIAFFVVMAGEGELRMLKEENERG